MSDLPDWRTIPEAERRRLLVDFCAQGLTSSQIANSFYNCSRSAAIGKLQRLGLKLNGRPAGRGGGRPKDGAPARAPRAPAAPKQAKRKPSPRTEETTSWRGSSNPHYNDVKGRAEMRAASPGLPAHLVAGEAREPIETGAPVSRNLKLVELTERTCKWPHGDPLTEAFGFCGNDASESGPYCRYHSRLASTPALHRLSVPKGA
ncbi:GcrA cell cycle regulator [Mesorhizobium sp. M2D.F.Ca.ET.232.01.1.1]|uniref:GcrA family cell cycle regulator n=1 Tax=Mesorhizobium sp. M2D.F.Ca.ET.232.01.1.1 TaxID=2496670 RepID=UPI000FCB7803|nr:GcrA family cell cycle regulator [Mesorhizobium sp. M2D.F.Ca.ET.232.01.1.1]TGP28232.1 GcrA cell cycle regulator [Mesorhizobium sp. M2D.F.Ca.ET.232.01.1.1]